MNYDETVEYLFNQLPVFQVIGPGAYKPGLDTAYALADAFGNPQRGLKCLHVAGTNGKGSTSHMLASVLAEAGYKVGLYTSPHIFDFRERIRINGDKIAQEAVADFVERYQAMNLDVQPSFFELTTIMAFDYFASQQVDFAVIEVGLGGRLDTTNIINPIISVITNISLDHKAQLGNTVEEIAREKAGIMKSGVPVVIGEADDSLRKVFVVEADKVHAPIVFAEDAPYDYVEKDSKFTFAVTNDDQPSAVCELVGEFQRHNINTVLTALNCLNLVPADAIRRGLERVVENTHLMGRWTTLSDGKNGPTVICDTGHNIGAWNYLAPQLQQIADNGKLRMVIGFVNDKDVNPIFALLPKNAEYYFVTPSVKRGRPAVELLDLAATYGLTGSAFDSVDAGYRMALTDSTASDTVFVGGSNYVVADLNF